MNSIKNNRNKILFGSIFFSVLLFLWIFPIAANDSVYGTVTKIKYLMGDYPREGNLKVFTNKIEKNTHTLREDTIIALNKMIEAYDRDREGKSKQHIFVVSAHRQLLVAANHYPQPYNHKENVNLQYK